MDQTETATIKNKRIAAAAAIAADPWSPPSVPSPPSPLPPMPTSGLSPRSECSLHPARALVVFIACTFSVAILMGGGRHPHILTVITPPAADCAQYKQSCMLFKEIGERVGLMRDVAAAKAVAQPGTLDKLCVYDAQQEFRILGSAAAEAARAGIFVAAAVTVAQLQADCAKQEQQHWLTSWEAEGVRPGAARPLNEVREELRNLTTSITESWSNALRSEWQPAQCSTLERELPPLLLQAIAGRARSGYCICSLYLNALLTSVLSVREPPCRLSTMTMAEGSLAAAGAVG
jgi:chorismate mutase